jgi:hypothetical protein
VGIDRPSTLGADAARQLVENVIGVALDRGHAVSRTDRLSAALGHVAQRATLGTGVSVTSITNSSERDRMRSRYDRVALLYDVFDAPLEPVRAWAAADR